MSQRTSIITAGEERREGEGERKEKNFFLNFSPSFFFFYFPPFSLCL